MWMSPRVVVSSRSPTASAPARRSCRRRNLDVLGTGARQDRPRLAKLMSLLTLMKSQPLACNKDNQEDKEPLFDAVDTVTATCASSPTWPGGITVAGGDAGRADPGGFATATDLADYLVKKGLPFRGRARSRRPRGQGRRTKGVDLLQLTLEELRAFCPRVEKRRFSVLTVAGSLASRNHIGGIARIRSGRPSPGRAAASER